MMCEFLKFCTSFEKLTQALCHSKEETQRPQMFGFYFCKILNYLHHGIYYTPEIK